MVTDRTECSAKYDIGALVAEKAALTASGVDGDVGEQGSWHTHPDGHGLPSEADMHTWLNAHDFLGMAFYTGLIVTAHPSDERWSNPKVHGWIVRRLRHTGLAVCEPAVLEGVI